MVIPPSTIIMLCDYAPNTKPLFNGLALAEAYKRGSFRTRINDTEYFIAFTENTKNLFYEEEFLGGMIVIRKKGEPKQGKKPPMSGNLVDIEDYETPLGVEVIINHVGDCFD